jgi:hypothetical protein
VDPHPDALALEPHVGLARRTVARRQHHPDAVDGVGVERRLAQVEARPRRGRHQVAAPRGLGVEVEHDLAGERDEVVGHERRGTQDHAAGVGDQLLGTEAPAAGGHHGARGAHDRIGGDALDHERVGRDRDPLAGDLEAHATLEAHRVGRAIRRELTEHHAPQIGDGQLARARHAHAGVGPGRPRERERDDATARPDEGAPTAPGRDRVARAHSSLAAASRSATSASSAVLAS